MEGYVVWSLKWSSNISKSRDQNIKRIFGQFYEDILDDFIVYSDMESHLQKFKLFFSKV
jgi:hypothetical protein